MANKNLFKKIVSVAMAGALTLSMALPVGAATNSVMSASVVPVESGDKVVSAFGTVSERNYLNIAWRLLWKKRKHYARPYLG